MEDRAEYRRTPTPKEEFDKLSEMRGFKEPLRFKARLTRGDEVWYEGSLYRVIHQHGKPVMVKVEV